MHRTVPDLLAAVVRADPGRPAVTWIDPRGGARVELSRATLVNWVAKIGGLLQDVVDVERGQTVRVRLPAHWLAVAWPLACWSLGAVVAPAEAVGPCHVEVTGDDDEPPDSGRLVVVGLAPLGGVSRRPLPPGALDAGAEVLGQPDDLVVDDPPARGSPAVSGRDHEGLLADAHARAEALDLPAGGRLATDLGPCTAAGLVETVLAPLVRAGSLVLATGPGPGLAAERPDVWAGSLRQ